MPFIPAIVGAVSAAVSVAQTVTDFIKPQHPPPDNIDLLDDYDSDGDD